MLCGGNMSAFLLILLGIAFMIFLIAFVLGLGVLMTIVFSGVSFGLCVVGGLAIYIVFMGILFKLMTIEANNLHKGEN